MTILSDVNDKLKEHGQSEICKNWCILVRGNKFPLDNICYLLFFELVTSTTVVWLLSSITFPAQCLDPQSDASFSIHWIIILHYSNEQKEKPIVSFATSFLLFTDKIWIWNRLVIDQTSTFYICSLYSVRL